MGEVLYIRAWDCCLLFVRWVFGDTSMTDKALNSFHASSFYCNLIKAMSNGGEQGDGWKNMENCVCEICDHDLGFRCGMQNDCYGSVEDINDCEDFEYMDDSDDLDDDSEEPIDVTEPIECPICGEDAYWDGSCYVCENDKCNWCGIQ